MENKTFELATGLCNQDSVEHLFSKFRQRGGFNNNPTARIVRCNVRHIICIGYIHTNDKGNVQCPEAECLINSPTKLIKSIETCMTASNISVQHEIDPEDELFNDDVNILEEYDNAGNKSSLSTYDYNAIAYFAGYVARKSIAQTKCDNCRNIMMKTPMDDATANEKYIELREFSNSDEDAPSVTKLIRPTTLFAKVIEIQLHAIDSNWERYWASTTVLQNITKKCINVTNNTYSEWFHEDNSCYKHRLEAVQFLIRVKLYSRTRYNNRAQKTEKASRKKIQKLLNK
jgi:hypothetical protein